MFLALPVQNRRQEWEALYSSWWEAANPAICWWEAIMTWTCKIAVISTWFHILTYYFAPMLIWANSYPICQCHTSSEHADTEVAFPQVQVRMKICLVWHLCVPQSWNLAGFQQRHPAGRARQGEANYCNTKTCFFRQIYAKQKVD